MKGSIVDYVGNFEVRLEGDKQRIKFKVKVGKKVFDQLVDYQAICDFIEDETMNPDGSYNMDKINIVPRGGRIKLFRFWHNGKAVNAHTSPSLGSIRVTDSWWLSMQEITVYWRSGSHHALS